MNHEKPQGHSRRSLAAEQLIKPLEGLVDGKTLTNLRHGIHVALVEAENYAASMAEDRLTNAVIRGSES